MPGERHNRRRQAFPPCRQCVRVRTFPWSASKSGIGGKNVIAKKLAYRGFGEALRQHVETLEIPMRIIRGEQQHIVAQHMVERLGDVRRIVWSIERLRGDTNMASD